MQVCLFDIDGTLILSGGAGKTAMENALSSEFHVSEPIENVPFSGRTDRAIALDLFRKHDIEASQKNYRQFIEAYLQYLPKTLATHRGRVLPGVVALLNHLFELSNCALGLLTGNVRNGARLKLDHYDLFHYFAFGGFGDNHFGRDDVAREAIDEVQHHHPSISSEQIWVIGDTPLDIDCARSIGARAVAVASGFHTAAELEIAKPDLLLESLSDSSTLLEMWL